MPIYEYECTKCGHQTEIWQKFSDLPITKCDSCRGKMKKLMSQSTFHLKGSGWYVTDYASKHNNDQGKSEKSTKDSTTKETKGSTDQSKKDHSSASKKKAKD